MRDADEISRILVPGSTWQRLELRDKLDELNYLTLRKIRRELEERASAEQ